MTIFFHVNAYKHLTAKGLPFLVIQPGSDANPGSCISKEALSVIKNSSRLETRKTCALLGILYILYICTKYCIWKPRVN